MLTMMSGAVLAVPIEAAERYIPGVYVYKAAIVQLSLWGLLSQKGEALVRPSLRQPPTAAVTTPPWITTTAGLLRPSRLEFLQQQNPMALNVAYSGPVGSPI